MQDSPQTMDIIIMYLFGAYEQCFILKQEVIASREKNHPIILWDETRKLFGNTLRLFVFFCEDVGNIMTKYHC